MSPERMSEKSRRIRKALDQLQRMILERYPDASFAVFRGEDPEGIYLRATVEVDDPDDVVDLVIDRLFDLQVQQGLPVYLIPVRPTKGAATETAAAK